MTPSFQVRWYNIFILFDIYFMRWLEILFQVMMDLEEPHWYADQHHYNKDQEYK